MENIHNILYIILNVIGICANIVVLYIIIYLHRNVRTVPNILFANCMVSQIFLFLCGIIVNVLLASSRISLKPLQNTVEAELTFFIAALLSVLLVVIDWTLAAYIHRTSETFRKFYIVAIAIVWGLSLINCFARLIIKHTIALNSNAQNYFFQFLFYLIFVVTVIIQIYRIIQLCNHRQFENSALLLNLTSIWLILQLPLMIVTTLFHIDIMNYVHFNSFGICANYIADIQPIINLVLLLAFYRHFKESIRNSLNQRQEGFARYGNPNNQNEQYHLNAPFNANRHV